VRSLVQGVTRVSKLDPTKLHELEGVLPTSELPNALLLGNLTSAASSNLLPGGDGALTPPPPQGAACDDVLRLLHACAGDWRVAVLKVADRLHNMRTLEAMKPHKRARKAQETERVFVPLAHYLGAHDVGDELASLAALHRSDDQPQHRVWASKLASALFSAADHHFLPHQRLATALLRGIADPPSRRLSSSSRSSSSSSSGHNRPSGSSSSSNHLFPHTAEDSKDERRNFRKLILQLSDSEPTAAQHLYTSLRPLHERLARHQAVMMGFGWDGAEDIGKAEYSRWTTSYYDERLNNGCYPYDRPA